MQLRSNVFAVSLTLALATSAVAGVNDVSRQAVSTSAVTTQAAVAEAANSTVEPKASALVDAKTDAYRVELLDLAYRAAGAFPAQPHLKNRTRLQEDVVDTCLRLDQPERALRYADGIEGWRRGSVYADVALYLARRGESAERVQPYVDQAEEVIRRVESQGEQDWARDRIRVKIAGVYLLTGRVEKAREYGVVATEAEAGKVAVFASEKTSSDEFDDRMKSLAKVIEIGGLDQTRNALEAYARLFDLFYADEARRTTIAQTIRTSWDKSPVQLRFDVMMRLSDTALRHGDPATSLKLVHETEQLVESVPWTSEDRIQLRTQLAAARHRAGDEAGARAELESVLAFYEKERLTLSTFDRGLALRAIAETYRVLGDAKSAIVQYGRAIDAASQNPNARPRAEVLVDVCRSMAEHGTEPDAELRARLEACAAGLKSPW